MGSRTVIYVGDDGELCSALSERSVSGDYELIVREMAPGLVDEGLLEQWNRVVVLDTDVAERVGFALLRSIKRYHAGVPVVVVADRDRLPLTQAAVACANGAEAVCLKPIEEPQLLVDIINDGFRRQERWRRTLSQLTDKDDGRPSVVVAEHDPERLRELTTILTAGGYRVLPTTDRRQALEFVRSQNPHLLLADHRLQVEDGLALCRAVRSDPSTRDVPVLIIPHVHDDDLAAEANAAGAFGVVATPIAVAELLDRVAEACDAAGRDAAVALGVSR